MQITPLSDVVDEPEDAGGATAFFLKEKPKPKPKPVVHPVTPAVTSQPHSGMGPPQPIVGQQSAAASSGFAGISGPVATGQPQQAATMASHETLSEEPDSGGHKVKILVALLGLAGTGFIGIILVVGLWFYTSTQDQGEPDPEPSVVASNTKKPSASTEDTAIEVEQPPAKPRSYASGGGSSKPATSSTSSKPASKPAPPPSGPGPVTIVFSGAVSHSGGQLRCGSGFKASASFQGSKMIFANVPKEDGCTIKLKGGGPANINYGVTANATLNCEYANGGADVKCR